MYDDLPDSSRIACSSPQSILQCGALVDRITMSTGLCAAHRRSFTIFGQLLRHPVDSTFTKHNDSDRWTTQATAETQASGACDNPSMGLLSPYFDWLLWRRWGRRRSRLLPTALFARRQHLVELESSLLHGGLALATDLSLQPETPVYNLRHMVCLQCTCLEACPR